MEDKTSRIEAEKKELDKQATEISRRLAEEEEACQQVANATKKLTRFRFSSKMAHQYYCVARGFIF